MSTVETERHEAKEKYEFSVDGRHYSSESEVLNGAQIKARASVDPTFGLFLEGQHGTPDKQIRDDEEVNLQKGKHKNEFYTMPPATFGVEAR